MDTIRVLLIEDNPGDARLVTRMLNSAKNLHFEIQYAGDLKTGLKLLKSQHPDVVLLDLCLPDCRELEGVSKVSAAVPNVPLIVLTGTDVPRTILDTIKIGVRDYFVKSRIEAEALVAAILRQTAWMRQFSRVPAKGAVAVRNHLSEKRVRVLVVEDNPGDLTLIRRMLDSVSGVQFDIIPADKLAVAIEKLRQGADIILLDLTLPDSQDIETLRRVRAEDLSTPILILTGMEDRQKAVSALANGAQDYLVKGQVDSRLLGRAILRHLKTDASEPAKRSHG